MCSAYVWPRLVQGQGKKLTLLPLLHMGYSSPSVIALVYEFTLLYKKIWFHPVTYGGRHDCFRFRKHPSSSVLIIIISLIIFLIFSNWVFQGIHHSWISGRRKQIRCRATRLAGNVSMMLVCGHVRSLIVTSLGLNDRSRVRKGSFLECL